MKRLIGFLALACFMALSLVSPTFAHIGDWLPGTTGEVEAAYTVVSSDGLSHSYVSSGQFTPSKELKLGDSECAYLPGMPYGGHCIRLAGGGAQGGEVADVKYFWRPATGHSTPWEPCVRGSGCRAFDFVRYGDGRVVATFLISHVPNDGDRDFRMDVILKPKAVAASAQSLEPTTRAPTPSDPAVQVYQNFEKNQNRAGKYN